MSAPDELWTVPFDEQDTNIIGFASRVALDDSRCVRYIRAPESAASNALAIAMGGWMHRFDNAPTMEAAQRISRAWCEWMLSNKYSILGALRALKPDKAVPRDDERTTLCWSCNAAYPFVADSCPTCGAFNGNAATKAGAGDGNG